MSTPPQWCLGFIFDEDNEHVMLGLKTGGIHMNRWNGVGGNLEREETPFEAMRREGFEETGNEISDWKPVGEIHGPRENPWVVHVFFAKSNVRTWLDRALILNCGIGSFMLVRKDGLSNYRTAPHVRALIAHVGKMTASNCGPLIIQEV